MTATSAPALAVLCLCGHAARMHDSDGCLRNLCGCSRDRGEAAATAQSDTDTTPQSETLPAPVPQPAATPAASLAEVVAENTQPPREPAPAEPPATSSAPVSDPSSEAGAASNPEMPPALPSKPVAWADLADALTRGAGHDDPRIASLATRINGELQALQDLLAEDTAKATLRARRDELKAELAQVEAELNATPPPDPDEAGTTSHVLFCEQCGQGFERPQALGAHRRYKHNGAAS